MVQTNIPARLHSVAEGNIVTGANEIFDDEKNKKQSTINTETDETLAEITAAITNVSSRLNAGYIYLGLADPETIPTSATGKFFYIASQAGTYHFMSNGDIPIVISSDGLYILSGGVEADDWLLETIVTFTNNVQFNSSRLITSGGVFNAINPINELLHRNYILAGVAETTTIPTDDTNVFYLAGQGGTYTHFLNGNEDPLVLPKGLTVIYRGIEDDGWNYWVVYADNDFINTNRAQALTSDQQTEAQNNLEGKLYEPAQFSGLGKKVLAQNIQQVSGVSKNVMTQAFFEDDQGNALTNTVFVIQYDYTLGENIVLPTGCTLQFDGGSIDLGQYTMSGALINDELNVTDFSKDNDITKGLQCCVNLCGSVFIPKGSYTISSTINVGSNKYIYGKEAVITTNSIINAFNLNGDNIKIDGIEIIGKVVNTTDNPAYLIYSQSGHSNIEVLNCVFSKCTGAVYIESDTTFIKLHDNKVTDTVFHPSLGAGGYGFVLDNPDSGLTTLWDNAEIYSNYIEAVRHCLYIQIGRNCQIHDNTFIMDVAHGSNDYDGCIMDGGVENINIYNNTIKGGKCFYIFANYAQNILTDKLNINISNNKIQDISTRSYGVIQFDTDGSKLNVNIVNNDMYLTEGTQSGIFIRGNGIDGFNIEGNTITINDALNLASVHGIWINLNKSSEEASDNTKDANNINIINNNIVNKTATITVYVSGGNTNGNSCIKNIKILNNSIDGGSCAVSMQENKDVKNILIKNNICKGQSYTNIYFDNNSGVTKDIICTENILQIDPNSASGIGVDLHISQGQNSVIKDNLETL